MFEAHVLYILRRYLGQYVRGLSPEALQISVWKGDVVLKDLQLKAEALNALRLPITVKAGFLGSVTLKVPWNRLGRDPVIVLLDRVFVLAEPVEDERLFSADSRERWVDAKRGQIEELEMAMLENKEVGTASTSSETKSWMGSFFATIIGNLKISVTNLHIRYEDTLSNPSRPFCFGVTLAKLAAVTIDEKGVETFVTSGALDRLNKSLQLEKFSVYHDSDTQPWKIEKQWDQLTAKEWSEIFEPSIRAKVDHQYLLDPVGGAMKYHRLGKRDKREPETPFQRASLVLDLVSFNLSEAQYLDGLKVLESVSRYRTRMEFFRYRPLVPVREDPKAWWKYAYQAVLIQQNNSRLKYSWDNISKRCRWRKKYLNLYANSLQQGKADTKDIRDMDKELEVEVALLWRLLAHAKVETARLVAASSAREKAKRGSWWTFGWGNVGPKDAGSSPGWENPGELTKEEWNKINELVSYQPGQDFSLLSRQEAPNMLQTAFEVTLTQSVARLKNGNNLEILRGTFSSLDVGLKMYPKMLSCNCKLASYGLSAPEGELIESVSREGKLHALELKYVYAPLEEQLDWKLAVAMSPCYVTFWRSSLDRALHFLKSGQALSPSVALETAAVVQSKLEEVTRRAQEHLQTQLSEQRRFSVDLDIDAPKVKIPVLQGQKTQLLVDLGHFSLRTVEDNEAKPHTYSKFSISARDISALFADGVVEWCTFDSLSSSSTLPILDRCGMSIMFHQARLDSPTLPSSCMAIDVPRLGLHFSPARYQRLLHLMNALEAVDTKKSNLQSPWKPEDYSSDARVIFWGGIGNIRAKWEACWLALTGSYLYILEDQNAVTYRRCCSMNGKQVLEIPSSLVGGAEHVIAVCGRGLDTKMAIESSTAVVIQLKSDEAKASWMKCLTFATYRSSAPVSLLVENDESPSRAVNPSKHFSLFIVGVLKELQISVSGKMGSSEEAVIAELQALGGEVKLLQRPFDMKIATKLHSLKIEDKLQGFVSPSCRYVARSVLSASSAGEHETVEEGKEDDYEQFRDALPEFASGFTDGSQKHVTSYEPGRTNFLQTWVLMDQAFEKNDGEEASDFVRVMLILRQPQSDEYAETDIEMTMSMATLDFFCNRPTLVAFIDFGAQLGGILEGEASPPTVSLDDTAEEEQEDIVKGLLGRGKSRVVFRLKMDMESARIFLNLEDGSQLAMLAQDKFQMDLKVYPGSFTVSGNLGNLRVCDMRLGQGHQWGWLCDIRDPTSGSLVTLEFQSFGRDEDDFKGYDYSLSGRMSAVRIVFLYRFVQEVSCYFTALASPQVHQVITVVDTTAGIERLIQKTDIEGAPGLKLDLTMDTPIIVMPRDSHSKEFMELDLGHLKLSNNFEWHGGSRSDASAVHLDVLVAELTGINMVVGVDGKAGKSMIQEVEGLQVIVRRPLRDIFRKVPEVQVDVQVQTFCGKMSDREYLVIIDCAAANVNESPDLPANFRESSSSESDEQESSFFKSVQLEEQHDSVQNNSVQEYYTKVWVIIDVQYAGLELFKGVERESSLARVEIHGLWLGYRSSSTLEADVYVTLPKLSVVDLRPGTNSEMRLMFGSMADVEKSESKADDSKSVARLTMLVMDLRMKPDAQTLVMRMQRPRLLVVVDFLLEVTQFFVPSLVASSEDPIVTSNHIRLCTSVHQQQVGDITLSTDRQLIADAYDIDEFIYDGCGRAISLKFGDDYSGEPVIIIGYGKKLRFKNVRIKNGSRIHECVQLVAGASYSVLPADGVVLEQMNDAVLVVAGDDNIAPISPRIADSAESNQDFLLDIQIVAPELTFYDSTKWPSSNWLRQERLLRAKLDFNLMLSVKGETHWIRAYVKGLTLENSSGALVVDPIDISAEYARAQGKSNIMVTATDIFMRPSFNVARLVMRLHDDTVEKFKFGNNVLFRCTHFDRIWVNKSGGLPEITFWRPRVPPGAVTLGDCATSGMTPPSQGVVAVSNVHQRVQKPESFELVWSSEGGTGASVAEDEVCCVWLPVAPPGYVAVGCVAERGTVPPPLDTAYCIRSDLVTSSAVADCIFYIPPGDRDNVNGCSIWRVDNTIGSFFARPSTEPPPKQALVDLRQLLLADLSNVGNDKADDDAQDVKILQPPGRTKSLQPRTPTKTGRNSLTTPQFERVWWDKGNETRRVVSIWRPVPPAGYSIVGDTIVDGLEPPNVGLVLRDDGSGRLIRPIRFQQRVHICGRGLEDVYIWSPVPPAGYVTMGCVATIAPVPPSLDLVRCVRQDLVGQGNLSKRPVWSYIGGNSCRLWRVENQASTFIARADLKRPPPRVAYYLAESRPKVRDTLTAEMKIGRLSLTVVHDLTGLETPLINATMTGINLAAHGRPDTLNAVALMSVAASSFNAGRDAWEPLIEPFDGILKYEYYDGDPDATLKFGRRVRVSAASTVNINVTTAGLQALLGAGVAWQKQTLSEQQALTSMRLEGRDYKRQSRIGTAALEEDDTEKLTIHNRLFCQLYVRTYESDFQNVEVLPEGASRVISLPPPRFPEKMASALEAQPRQFVAVHVLEATSLPVNDDGNCPDFLCALRLVTTKQSTEEQKAHQQSARSRCIRPSSLDASRASASWNEVFIFEIPIQGSANLEVVVTNQAARSGKGEAVGILAFPVKEESSQKVSQPSSLWKLVRLSINKDSSSPLAQAKVLKLRPPRRKMQGNGNLNDCGEISVQLSYFSTGDWSQGKDEKSNAKDFGLLFSQAPDGPWESLKGVLPVTSIPAALAGQPIIVEVNLDQGRKHATFRGLVLVANNTDMLLEVAICPSSLLHIQDSSEDASLSENAIKVVEECFENQRYQPLAGWGSKWPGHLIPSDPGRWSNRDYSESSQELLRISLPPGWIWASDWFIDKSQNVDQDGWYYGPDFHSLRSLPTSSRSAKKSTFDFARRRRWIRIRQRIPQTNKSHRREIVGVVEPGSLLNLPLGAMAPETDYCAQVRPVEGRYLWGQMVDSNISSTPQSGGTQRRSLRQSKSSVSSSSFTLSQLEKHEQLLLCVAADTATSKGHCWFSMEAFEQLQAGDWKLSVDAPLRLENLLPCNAEYIIWEKVNDSRPVKRQHGIAPTGECVHIYAADIRRQIFLTWFPQGGWRPEKEGVLIFDPRSEELPLGFWMTHQQNNRRLRVSLEYDFGSSNFAAKVVRLFVPYWLTNDAGLPLMYRLVEVDPSSDSSSAPRGSRTATTSSVANEKERIHRTVRMFDIVEKQAAPIMLSPHAQPERLGPVSASARVEDALSPRIGLSVAIEGHNTFGYGFSFRELEDNKDHVHLRAYDSGGGYYKLSVQLDLSFERTKIVRLQPHSIFLNRLGKRLQMRQRDTQVPEFLYPNQELKTFQWRSSSQPEQLRICLEGYRWSLPFGVDVIGTMHVNLISEAGSHILRVRVEVRSSVRHSSQLIIFRYASTRGPYRIENKSSISFCYRQYGREDDSWQILKPGSSVSFAWESLRRPLLLELLVAGADSHTSEKYDIDEAQTYQPLSVPGHAVSAVQVTTSRDASAQLVSISDFVHRGYDSSALVPYVPSSARPTDRSHRVDVPENQFHTSVELAELGVSIVDDTPEELLYLSVQNFCVSYSTGLGSQISRFKLKFDGIQVDNQLPLTPMPVLFSPQEAAKEADFLFKCTVTMKDNGLSDKQAYPYIGIQGPNVPNVSFLVNIHEPIIWRVHQMIDSLMKGQQSTGSDMDAVPVDPIICIGLLNTSEIRFKVTLAMAPTQRPRGVLGFWSTLLTSLGNTDDMPVRITAHVHEDICMSRSALISAAIESVRNDMLGQPLKLLSGVDLLGNASSALGHMSKGVAALSMDKKFIRSRQKQETKTTVEDIGDGIREGGGALAKGFFRGVTGIVTKPFEGAKSSGVEGFIQGVGKGVIGAAVQPMSGILDLLSKTTEGANATRMKLAAVLTSEEQLLRRRLPRVIGGDKIIRPYDEYKAQGQILLQLAQRGTLFGPVDIFKSRGKFASDAYEDHFNLPKARTLILTHRRVVLLQHPTGLIVQKKPDLLKNPCTICWDVPWQELGAMELAHGKQESRTLPPSRLIIYLKTTSQDTSMFDTRDSFRVVKCHPGTNQAAEIMASIERAQETYGPQQSLQAMKTRAGSKPYAGTTARSGAAIGLLTGPSAPVSVPALATFGSLLGTAHQSVLSAEAYNETTTSSSSTSSSASAVGGRYISSFTLIWSNKGDSGTSMSIWRPVCPSGHACIGDVIHESDKQPDGVMVFQQQNRSMFALPLGFELVWREDGDEPLTIWRPVAPDGYIALGCVAVADFYEPEPDSNVVWCVNKDNIAPAPLVEPALRRGEASIWRVGNEARTFLVQKENQPPPEDACFAVVG